ncbi:hypothetical protein LRP88_06370 [Fusarium phalaenopsidis]
MGFSAQAQSDNTLSACCYFSLACKAIATLIAALFLQRLLAKPRSYELFPVWATIEIALASYLLRGEGLGRRIFSVARRYGGSLFGFSSRHQILVHLPDVDRLMARPLHTLTAEPVQYTLFTRVFGGVDSSTLKGRLQNSWKDLLSPIERLFLNDAAATAAIEGAGVAHQAAYLVTLAPGRDKKRWELSADVRIISPSLPMSPGVAEASLQSLARDFGACTAIPLLYGKDFLDRHPSLLDDFWKFYNDLFPLLMIGVPSWVPFRAFREGLRARSRLLEAIEGLYRRIDQHKQGQHVDCDMSDVHDALFERNKVYEREGWSFEERAAGDLAVFWGQNANTQPVLFWLLTYVYSTQGLVARVRDDIAPYVKLSQTAPPAIMLMDIPGLSNNCQLLKACIFETYRMVNEPTSIRHLERTITINDSEFRHELKAGTLISVPHSLTNHDASVYEDPAKYIPERFLDEGRLARCGRLRPWGVGTSMCKGRTFAEKEIMTLGAAIVSLWDIGPAGGTWKLPAMIPGTGVRKPIEDIRVTIKPRTV